MTVNPSDVVIWSADVDEPTLGRALRVPNLRLRRVKLDRVALTIMGLSKIRDLQAHGFEVFADAKIVEIPDKVMELAKLHLKFEPWMLNVMADIWSTGYWTHIDQKKVDALKRFADACREAGTLPCGVTVLTSTTEEVVRQKFNERSAIDQVLVFVEQLLLAGFTDVVCSPLEVKAIRSDPRFDQLKLNTPGIRMPDTSSDDQARIATPAGAIRNGSDRLVIGRNLTDGNLAENFERIAADLATL